MSTPILSSALIARYLRLPPRKTYLSYDVELVSCARDNYTPRLRSFQPLFLFLFLFGEILVAFVQSFIEILGEALRDFRVEALAKFLTEFVLRCL